MERFKFETPDLTKQNIEKIERIFPNCITEDIDENGNPKKAINFDILRQMLSDEIVEGDEAYEFSWVGKKNAMLEANKPIRKTLRPCKEESVNWENTENLYIEGDNLEVLKLLQESYLGTVKMIYIDPPYNTGNDSFTYPDDFSIDNDEYLEISGQVDENGTRLFKENSKSNPRFHSVWCSMMYSRLLLARNLLSDDGVIFISIDDHEVDSLKKICVEIFGEENFLCDVVWNSTKSVTNTALISVSHTHNLVFFKNIDFFVYHRFDFRLPDEGEGFDNPDKDERGPWKADPFQVGGWRPNQQYDIVNPNTGVVYKPNSGCSWKNDYNHYLELVKDNRIVFGKNGKGGPQRKRFLWEAAERGKVAKTLWDEVETTTNGTQQIKQIFDGNIVFSNPKPVGLIKKIIILASNPDSIILDFFSGSATTAHAVMKLNAEDGGNRKFIMVQLQEPCKEDSEAFKAGYKNICEIGKERIRRAAKKIKEENPNAKFDGGFRVFKVADSNMNDVFYSAGEYSKDLLSMAEDNIKSDRTDMDLLYGCLLDWGVPISMRHKGEIVNGFKIHIYGNGEIIDLIACFEENISESLIKEIARKQPLKAVFRDSCFANSPSKINAEEIFKLISPDTRIKVI